MTLEHQAIYQKLETLLKYHGRLQRQNRDKQTLTKVEAQITEAIKELELLNNTPISQTVVR